MAVSYDNGWSKIYINGTISSSQKAGEQDEDPGTPVLFGAMLEHGQPLSFFDGAIDEVGLARWRRARRSP